MSTPTPWPIEVYYENYVDQNAGRFPHFPQYVGVPRSSQGTQTEVHVPRNEGATALVKAQAALTGCTVNQDGDWTSVLPVTTSEEEDWMKEVRLCLEEVEEPAVVEDTRNDKPNTNYNLRERHTVSHGKVVKVTCPSSLDIKPRKRGRPRKKPLGGQDHAAVQTNTQINAMFLV